MSFFLSETTDKTRLDFSWPSIKNFTQVMVNSFTDKVKKNPHIFCFMEKQPYAKFLNFREKQLISQRNFREKYRNSWRKHGALYRQNLKISGRNTGISWRKLRISWRNFPLFLPEKLWISQKWIFSPKLQVTYVYTTAYLKV